jgi:hypothetical protein
MFLHPRLKMDSFNRDPGAKEQMDTLYFCWPRPAASMLSRKYMFHIPKIQSFHCLVGLALNRARGFSRSANLLISAFRCKREFPTTKIFLINLSEQRETVLVIFAVRVRGECPRDFGSIPPLAILSAGMASLRTHVEAIDLGHMGNIQPS